MKDIECDTSGFQNIVLMLIGVLMILLISNVLTIISNPENIKIGSVVTGAAAAMTRCSRQPTFRTWELPDPGPVHGHLRHSIVTSGSPGPRHRASRTGFTSPARNGAGW